MKPIPRIKFAHLPTPIEALPRLSTLLGGPRLYVKRDDQTGLGLGGNKTRKLEFLIGEALGNGALTLITAGAVQSNHCRQTAAAAARFGLGCILVLYGDKPTTHTGNLLLDQLFGAEIIWTERTHRDELLKAIFEESWAQGKRPYLIPYGGSNPTGASGYSIALQELLSQTGDNCPLSSPPDWIVVASSSGGTQAGLTLGAKLFNYVGKILGISIDEPREALTQKVSNLANQTADLLGEKFFFHPQEILVNADYLGGGYGVVSKAEIEAIGLFGRTEGILLDPVYTGRAAAGLIDLIAKGFFKPEESVLFWHTGGSPALFADKYAPLLV